MNFFHPLSWNAEVATGLLAGCERMQQLVRWAVSLFEGPVVSWALSANAAVQNKTKQDHPTYPVPFSRGTKAALC